VFFRFSYWFFFSGGGTRIDLLFFFSIFFFLYFFLSEYGFFIFCISFFLFIFGYMSHFPRIAGGEQGSWVDRGTPNLARLFGRSHVSASSVFTIFMNFVT
jgi:hypothetical protein